MKFHMKSSLMFLIITLILLVGLTAINASDVDQTSTQEIIKHNEVSTTPTTTATIADSSVSETHNNDDNLKEEETTIEKVNNTNTKPISKTNTTQSSKVVKSISANDFPEYLKVYVSRQAHEDSYDWATSYVNGYERGDGSRNNPTSLYNAINLLHEGGVIILLGDSGATETVYETRPNAPWINYAGSYYPGKLNNERNIVFTIMGEEGKTIVWSGQRSNTNMFSLSSGFNATLANIVFRNGNASGIDRSYAGAGPTADHGGAIDNRGNLQVINCTFEKIYANEDGGAIANYEDAHTLIENCTFKNIYSTKSDDFQYNTSHQIYGGAVSLTRTDGFGIPSVTVRNSNFTDIEAEYGGIFLNDKGIFTVENVLIKNTTATVEGGAIINMGGGRFTITNTTMTNLTSATYGGAVANLEGSTMIINGINITNVHVDNEDASEADMYGVPFITKVQ